MDFGLSMEKKVWLVEQGFRNVNDRLRECGHQFSEKLPGWLEELKAEAERQAATEKLDVWADGPNYEVHLAGVKTSMDSFAAQFSECMEENGGKAGRCIIESGATAAKDGDALYHLSLLAAMVKEDRRLLAAAAVVAVVIVGVLLLAVVGGTVIRKMRREEKEKRKSKEKSK